METVQELIDKYLTPEQRERFKSTLSAMRGKDTAKSYLASNRLPNDVIIDSAFSFYATGQEAYWKAVSAEYQTRLKFKAHEKV